MNVHDLILGPVAVVLPGGGPDETAVAAVLAGEQRDVRVAGEPGIVERLPTGTNGSSSAVMTSAGTRMRSTTRIALARW